MQTVQRRPGGPRLGRLRRAVGAGLVMLAGGGVLLAGTASTAQARHAVEPRLASSEWDVCVGPLPRFSEGPRAEAIAAGRWASLVFGASPEIDLTYHSTCEDDRGLLNPAMNVLVMHVNHSEEPWIVDTPCFNRVDPEDPDSPCSIIFVLLNVPRIEASVHPWLTWAKAACEGFGRAAGLGPRAALTSCMTPGASPFIAPWLDAHDRATISSIHPLS